MYINRKKKYWNNENSNNTCNIIALFNREWNMAHYQPGPKIDQKNNHTGLSKFNSICKMSNGYIFKYYFIKLSWSWLLRWRSDVFVVRVRHTLLTCVFQLRLLLDVPSYMLCSSRWTYRATDKDYNIWQSQFPLCCPHRLEESSTSYPSKWR